MPRSPFMATALQLARELILPRPADAPWDDSAKDNYAKANTPASSPWGIAFWAATAAHRFHNYPHPLLYPQGEKDLLGTVRSSVNGAPALVSPNWPYYGSLPLGLQPGATTPPPWQLGPAVPGEVP
jgi:hypothetical protein